MNVTDCVRVEVPIRGCKPHSHSQWEIIYNVRGSVTSCIGGKEYAIQPGDIMVIPPRVVHDGKSDGVYADMFFQADNLDFFDVVVVGDEDGSILLLMQLLHKVYTEDTCGDGIACDSLADTICAFIKKKIEEKGKYPFAAKVKNEIYYNLSNADFDLGAAIDATGYNRDYFRRCFHADYGKSPLEYLTDLRINQAKSLLVQDIFVSVEDVATSCGFADSFYFSTCFKKHTGISPSQYRKKLRNT